jgi:glycosyltransferase involved in cell wall biosynthesis
MTTLSLIVPCFNCARTIDAAIESIYRQNAVMPFDVTMVDDGSTDNTFAVMQELAARRSNIKLVRHSSNLGGGAARNTAVANSAGDLIFCLDSDDMLGPGFLENLTNFWIKKKCDGLGISKSIKFNGTDLGNIAYVTEFDAPGQQVPFESFLDGSICSLLSTFLITREAFALVGGYPTAHGFDTQGMAFRFLANGLVAFTCPDTVYFHRVNFHKSYYVREDRAGRFHWNWLQILLEFLYLFRTEVKATILDAEVFPTQLRPGLEPHLRELNAAHALYVDDYRALVARGRDGVARDLALSTDKYDQYWLGEYWLSRGQHAEALDCFVRALRGGFRHWLVYERVVEAAVGASDSSVPIVMTLHKGRFFPDRSGRKAESAAPPLSSYQRFENWLFRRPQTALLGAAAKKMRLGIRQLRGGQRGGAPRSDQLGESSTPASDQQSRP